MKICFLKKFVHHQNLFIIIVTSILLSSPLLIKGFFTAHDIHCHMFKTVATVEALLNGQLPPLIGPSLANGFGYSWNIFYAPLSAYIPAIFKIFLPTFIGSMKLFIFLTILASGITMYYFALAITDSKNTSLLAAIFYLTAPYRLEDIYIRGAMGEALAFVFIPVLFHGLYSLFNHEGKNDYLLTIGFTGLLLAHNISALMCVTAAIPYVLAHFKKLFEPKVLKALVFNCFFILALSLFYLVPLLEHRILGDYEVFLPNRMGSLASMDAQSLYPHQLLFEEFKGGELNFNLGLQLLVPLFFAPLAYKRILSSKHMLVLLFLGLGSVFVMSRAFPWTAMPEVFSFVQFPWRYLTLAVFFLSIPCAYIIQTIYKELEIKHLIPIILIIFIYISPILAQTANDTGLSDQNFTKTDLIVEESRYSQGSAFFEYMPQKAKANIPYIAKREDRPLLVEGDAKISNVVKLGTNLQFDLTTSTAAIIELPYLYYLGWAVTMENQEETIMLPSLESDKGFVSIAIPPNIDGYVSAAFKGTLLTRLAYLSSFLSLLLFTYILTRKEAKKC